MKAPLGVLLVAFFNLASIRGDICNHTIAPSLCADDQQECTQDVDAYGCNAGTFCFPTVANGCFLFCPLTCELGEIFCPSVTQSDGCPSPPECLPRYDPETGCPNHCNIECTAGFIACPGVREGCCGARNECCPPPPTCVHEIIGCPIQNVDKDGCPFIPFEPASCEYPQLLCDGGHDQNGCRKPFYCHMPRPNDRNPQCAQYCPAACNLLFEYSCPTTFDINGCTNAPTCRAFGDQCPENKHYEHDGCPIEQTPDCPEGQRLCPRVPALKTEITDEEVFLEWQTCPQQPTCENSIGEGENESCLQPCPKYCYWVMKMKQIWVELHILK